MCSPNTPQIQPVVVWNQERSETQLHTGSVSIATKMLGFTRFLFDVTSTDPIDFSIVFQILVASVQPNLLNCSTSWNINFITRLLIVDFQSDSCLSAFSPFRFMKKRMNKPHAKPVTNQIGNAINIIIQSHSPPFKTSHTCGITQRINHMSPPK